MYYRNEAKLLSLTKAGNAGHSTKKKHTCRNQHFSSFIKKISSFMALNDYQSAMEQYNCLAMTAILYWLAQCMHLPSKSRHRVGNS